jgi:hypothetical protein
MNRNKPEQGETLALYIARLEAQERRKKAKGKT